VKKEQFIAFIEAPGKLQESTVPVLEELVKEFPYFQTAQLLLARAMHNNNSIRYGSQLKIAGAYAADRKALYQLIMHKEPSEAPITEQEAVNAIQPLAVPENDNDLLNNLVISAEEEKEPIAQAEKIVPQEEALQPLIEEIRQPETKLEEPALTEARIEEELSPVEAKEEIKKEEEVKQDEVKPEEIRQEPIEEKQEATKIEESKEEAVVPSVNDMPPLEQNIIVKAIDASIQQEVSEPFTDEEKAETGEVTEEKITAGEEKAGDDFDTASSHSFTDWLKHAKKAADPNEKKDEVKVEEQENEERSPAKKPKTRKTLDDLIEKFIQEEPKITRPAAKQEFFSPVNMARQSVQEDNNEYVTETLANIYLKQGSYAKAIKAYESLSLKFPEKKLYFAARIKEIKKIIKEQK
jgi:hypothetical protein